MQCLWLQRADVPESRNEYSPFGGGDEVGKFTRAALHNQVRRSNIGNGSLLLRNLRYSRYWAQKQGRLPTPVPATLRMPGDDGASLEDLIASTERGVLVTRFWYIRPVDPRTILYTGLTRDGTFLIENGKISKAVKNLRFNESPVFMLNNLEKMGRPERVSASESGGAGTAIVVPPIKIRDFNFTSLSDAI